MSIRTRLTLWYSAILVLIIVAMSVFLAWRLHVDLIHGLDASLTVRAQQIANALQDPEDPRELLDLEELTGPQSAGITSDGVVTQVVTPKGRLLVSVGEEIESSLLDRAGVDLTTPDRLTVEAGGDEYRMLAVTLERTGNILLVASSTEPEEQATKRLLILLAIALPAALALSVGGGYLLARRALLPIDRMTQTAAAIGADDSEKRLDVGDLQDEVGRLGHTLNGMLDRLQRALAEQRRFVADASHELRTPLAIMQSEIDVSLRSASTPEAARPVLTSTLEEVLRMSSIVEGLLTLAQAGEGRLELSSSNVDLADIARDVAARLTSSAAGKNVTIAVESSGPAVVWGDQMRLVQLVTNLVENAVKYTPDAGTVRVGVTSDALHAEVTVADDGPGISAEDIPHIFDRFYRVDRARTRDAGGAGLGLAICRSIAEAHLGDIGVETKVGDGSTFTVRIPKS